MLKRKISEFKVDLKSSYEKSLETHLFAREKLALGKDQLRMHNLKLYSNILLSLDGFCTALEKDCLLFFQPSILFKDPVTASEQQIINQAYSPENQVDFINAYLEASRKVLSLPFKKLAPFSLIDVFVGIDRTLYLDKVHHDSKFSETEPNGYQLLTNSIIEKFAKFKQLKKR